MRGRTATLEGRNSGELIVPLGQEKLSRGQENKNESDN
jgi:hypothetical protein